MWLAYVFLALGLLAAALGLGVALLAARELRRMAP